MSEEIRSLLDFGPFRLDLIRRRLTRGDRNVPMAAKAFDTLAALAQNAGETLTRDEILDLVWHETAVEENNLSQQISTLRKLLGDTPGDHRYIVTVPGVGYRFVAPMRTLEVPLDRRNDLGALIQRFLRRWDLGHVLAVYFILIFSLPVVIDGIGGTDRRPQTVAILAFSSQSGDEAIGTGITNTLRARLGSVEDIALRPSVPTISDPLIAGRELGVETVLVGSVQREDERIRVTVEIVDVNGSRVVWGRTFDNNEGGVFEMQDRIARDVMQRLQGKIVSLARQNFVSFV